MSAVVQTSVSSCFEIHALTHTSRTENDVNQQTAVEGPNWERDA